jgi:type IV pilus assembly protein PilY1
VSASGHAVLFIVNIQTGALIRKIDTQAGTAGTPNGLATPLLVDADGDGVVEYAYAGDLLGNMWKFDLDDAAPANWDVAYYAGTTPLPLYVAEDSLGNRQPITERPAVAFGPNGTGFLVLFGTGKFLEQSDRNIATAKTQSFYGIYDHNTGTAATDVVTGRTRLVKQTIDQEKTIAAGNVRITSRNAVDPAINDGWYIDLVSPAGFDGEMQVTDPLYRNGRVIFTTLIPDADICAYGGKSWLMEMDAVTGKMLNYPPLDLDISGLQSNSITTRPAVLTDQPGGIERKVMPTTSGGIEIKGENPGPGALNRQSWRQVR